MLSCPAARSVSLANLQVMSSQARRDLPQMQRYQMVQGTLILMRDSDRRLGPDAQALVLGVGGDTLGAISTIVDDHRAQLRPMALDLLWQVHF